MERNTKNPIQKHNIMKTYYKSRGQELAERKTEPGTTWKTTNRQPVKKSKELNGRSIPYMVEEEIDQAEITEQFKPWDFSMENLEEIGMDKKLPITMAQLSTLQLIDRMDTGAAQELDRMDAEEWAKKYLEQNKKENKQKDNKEN